MSSMTKPLLAVTLAALLCGSCLGKSPSVRSLRKQARAVSEGNPAVVSFLDGSQSSGRICAIFDTDFVLCHSSGLVSESSLIRFDQVGAIQEVKQAVSRDKGVQGAPRHVLRKVAMGVGIGAAAAAVTIVIIGVKEMGNINWNLGGLR
jgi:hypothetical protein